MNTSAAARRFLLQTWSPRYGACVDVVGVLAVGTDSPGHLVRWLPRVWDRADGWRARLATDDIDGALPGWLADAGGLQLTEIDPAPAGTDLRTATELAVDELLAVVVPLLDEAQ